MDLPLENIVFYDPCIHPEKYHESKQECRKLHWWEHDSSCNAYYKYRKHNKPSFHYALSKQAKSAFVLHTYNERVQNHVHDRNYQEVEYVICKKYFTCGVQRHHESHGSQNPCISLAHAFLWYMARPNPR